MAVLGLYRLGLSAPDLPALRDFYVESWSMELVESDPVQSVLRSNESIHGDLALVASDHGGLDHIAFTVGSRDELVGLAAALEEAGFRASNPGRGEQPGEYYRTVTQDPDGNRIELVVPESEGPKPILAEAKSSGPKRLGHVVLWSPQPEVTEAFYCLLGFRVSDRTHMGMSFLRCNTDHHTIAIARSSLRTGLQHAAFNVGDVAAVRREFGRLQSKGVGCIWGVGRHGPGNNVFSYYKDAAGHVVEYYGDMESVDDIRPKEIRYWGPEHKGDIWGVAGPAPESFRD